MQINYPSIVMQFYNISCTFQWFKCHSVTLCRYVNRTLKMTAHGTTRDEKAANSTIPCYQWAKKTKTIKNIWQRTYQSTILCIFQWFRYHRKIGCEYKDSWISTKNDITWDLLSSLVTNIMISHDCTLFADNLHIIVFVFIRPFEKRTYYAVAMSVCPSVRVFRAFFQYALRYRCETWYIHWVGSTTCRNRVSPQWGHFDLVYSQM